MHRLDQLIHANANFTTLFLCGPYNIFILLLTVSTNWSDTLTQSIYHWQNDPTDLKIREVVPIATAARDGTGSDPRLDPTRIQKKSVLIRDPTGHDPYLKKFR